jgi:predicted O-methyltransferase YrrM
MGNHLLLEANAQNMAAMPQPIQENTESRKPASGSGVLSCWVQYLLSGRHGGVLELMEFLYGNSNITPMQVPEELIALGGILAELNPLRMVEIGTGQGGTLFFLTRLASRQATIISIDLPEGRSGSYSLKRQLLYERFRRRGQKLRLLRGNSHLPWVLKRLKGVLGEEPIDFLFIDGDRRFAGVKQDFETYSPLVRKGGLIAFHDIVEGNREIVGDVPKFWNEVKSQYRHSEIVDDPCQPGYGIGLLYVD